MEVWYLMRKSFIYFSALITVLCVSGCKGKKQDDDAKYDDLTTVMYNEPDENRRGDFGVTVFGGKYAGEYYVPLYSFNDLRVYDCKYTEATYEIKEKKEYTIKSLKTYAEVLSNDKLVQEEGKDKGISFPVNIIADALDDVKESISKLTVEGETLVFDMTGFSLDYYAVPNEFSHGYVGMTVNKDGWNGVYGFELPSFTDSRYYENESTESTEFAGGVIKYTLKDKGSLYDLFIHEIMFDFDGLTGMGYYENESHSPMEEEWFKRCFDIALGEIYRENNLYIYSKPGDPALTNQLRYLVYTTKKFAVCAGVAADYVNTLTDVIIMDTINHKGEDYPVTEIRESAFLGNTTIQNLTIGANVTVVGANAFSSCTSLENITIKDHSNKDKIKIKENAFINCSMLKGLDTNDSVSSIGDYAFSKCSALSTLTLDEMVESIGKNAFSYCSNLKSVALGNSVKYIREGTFYKCGQLTSIELNNAYTIEANAFGGCDLREVNIPASMIRIEPGAFLDNDRIEITVDNQNDKYLVYKGFLLEKDKENYRIIASSYNVGSNDEEYEFGFNENDAYPISEITLGAIANRNSLKSIKFGPSLVSIASLAFRGCSNLEYVDLAKTSFTSTTGSAFAYCSNLDRFAESTDERHSINGHLNCVTILSFKDSGIKKLFLDEEDTLTSIQPAAFSEMHELVQIILPDSITHMFGSILKDCEKLGEGVDFGIIYEGSYEDWQKMEYRMDEWKDGIDGTVKFHFAKDNITRAVRDL